MDINDLVKLTARGWAPVFLLLLAEEVPGRQAVLLHRSGAPRSGFGETMERLITLGLVTRNPGHGHPLRPEYLITEDGRSVARALGGLRLLPGSTILRRNWSLPVLAAMHRPTHFAALGTRLQPITDRALSQSLKGLEGSGLIQRKVDVQARPPRPVYGRTPLGLQVAAPLDAQIVWS